MNWLIIICLPFLFGGCFFQNRGEFRKSKDVVEFVEEGGDPDKQFFYEGNPASEMSLIHFAALENDLDLVKFLVREGASPNSVDYDGRTPVMNVFAYSDNLEDRKAVISYLHEIADESITEIEGRDIYQYVEQYWGIEWANFLRAIK